MPDTAASTTAAQRGPNGYPNPCPVCGARSFQRCRSLTKGKITDTHAARVRGDWPPYVDEAHSV